MSTPFNVHLTAETRKAWVGSILFHLLLILIFYLIQADVTRKTSGFVEVTLGTLGDLSSVAAPSKESEERAPAVSKPSTSVKVQHPSAMKLSLPERKYPVADEVIRLPQSKKLDVVEQSEKKVDAAGEGRLVGEKDFGAGKSAGGEKLVGDGSRGVGADAGSGVGADIGRSIGYSIQWAGGGTRQKISGDLPIYPEGVNVEAQIRLQAVVAPDGSIKSVHPTQKAHVKMEEAAMTEVRFWKFERLDITQPQVDQTCTITFNFKLK